MPPYPPLFTGEVGGATHTMALLDSPSPHSHSDLVFGKAKYRRNPCLIMSAKCNFNDSQNFQAWVPGAATQHSGMTLFWTICISFPQFPPLAQIIFTAHFHQPAGGAFKFEDAVAF